MNRVLQTPRIFIPLSLLIVGGVVLFLGWQFWPTKPAIIVSAEPTPAPEILERRALDGVMVKQDQANPPLVAVMIENAKDAQPIAGIDHASLVYESLAEATITRFLAVFPVPADLTPTEDLIGPVRSVRPYYLTWAQELGALLAHVGGSPAALEQIKTNRILTLDEYFNDGYFHRARDRYAPHNVYISSKHFVEAATKKLPGTALERWAKNLPAWKFQDDTPEGSRGKTALIKISYPEPYTVSWQYDKTENRYTRLQWGGVHKTADNIPITTKNIVVIFQEMIILDEIGRRQFTTEGQGKAYLFRDGTALVGTWQKDSPSARMRLYDQAGNEMSFNAGTTWIEILPEYTPVTY